MSDTTGDQIRARAFLLEQSAAATRRADLNDRERLVRSAAAVFEERALQGLGHVLDQMTPEQVRASGRAARVRFRNEIEVPMRTKWAVQDAVKETEMS